MDIDFGIAGAGLIVGLVVGLTGMGGGALMTPILVLLFHISAPAAVASDLVAAFIMKPIGGLVHARRGTVQKDLVKWLAIGSVPFAFSGVLILKQLGNGKSVQDGTKIALGIALLLAATSMCVKAYLQLRRWQQNRGILLAGGTLAARPVFRVRPVPTMAIGAAGGLVVGMTSVGSGSLIIISLLLLYPTLAAKELVGTDLVQAVPLVGAAALGHILFGDFQLGLTFSLLLGSVPGVYVGARFSAVAPDGIIRRILVFVLMASGLKLLNVSTNDLGIILLAAVISGPAIWAMIRVTHGYSWRGGAAGRTPAVPTARSAAAEGSTSRAA
ncbi:MAG: sulfite exporter TauE/SafE family protein [Frankiaceae bacterium]